MNDIALFVSGICLILIIVITIVLVLRDISVKKDMQAKLDSVVNQINEVNTYKYLADKQQQTRMASLENDMDMIKKTYVSEEALKESITTRSINVTDLKADSLKSSNISSGSFTGDNVQVQKLTTFGNASVNAPDITNRNNSQVQVNTALQNTSTTPIAFKSN